MLFLAFFYTGGVLACGDSAVDEAATSLGSEGGGAAEPSSPLAAAHFPPTSVGAEDIPYSLEDSLGSGKML